MLTKALTLTALGCVVLGSVAFVSLPSEAPKKAIVADPAHTSAQGAGGCPAGLAEGGMGPAMVRTPEGFCIDVTEVSRVQYAALLTAPPAASGQGAECVRNDDFTPSCEWPPKGNPDHPVVCVDWCDAKAFCQAAGKRLCGSVVDGSSYAFESYADPALSEWQAACSAGGRHEYTYGDTLDTKICRSGDADDYTEWGLGAVGSFAGCHSPEAAYAAVHDLSGNAAEWDNSCVSDSPEAGCHIRGGSYQHNKHGLRCAMGERLEWPRMFAVSSVGFRCCAD